MAAFASNLYFLILLSILYARYELLSAKIITLGSSLSPTIHPTSWPSPSGRFAFGFYKQGNGFKVGIWLFDGINKTIVWTANRDDPSVSSNASLVLTKNGKFFLHKTDIANTLEPANSASMLDSGNFVLYGRNNSVIWQSFDFPTDTILGGQSLSTGNGLASDLSESNHSSGYFVLRMQDDGNLVAYPLDSQTGDNAFWASNSLDTSISQLTLNLTGFLFLGNDMNTIKVIAPVSKQIERNTSLVIYRATLNIDGNFVLYAHIFEKNNNTGSASQILWQAISDICHIKGFCGFNSYCSNDTGKAECKCYPGFNPTSNGSNNANMFLVCEEIMKNDCITSKNPRILYNVSNPLQHVEWSLVPYLAVLSDIEVCGKSCQEDCDCGAVLYEDGICKKYKLPLTYGRINPNSASTALFKLPSGITITSTTSNKKGPFVVIDHKKSLTLTLIFTLGSISCVCLIFAFAIFFIYKRQVHSYRKLSASANLGYTEDCSLRIFSFDDLVIATGNFAEEIGRGSFGVVYKGTIRGSNRLIAVKKIDKVVDEGQKEFQAEITAIARTHHRNLVQLLGYCIDGSRKLLVYEYMSNGSLADFLFKAEMHLSWKQRVKIALDVAKGILYLHEECEVCIVHCNIKPRNILLDAIWTAKISDFGLARLSVPETSELTSGYVAPERQKDASTSTKVDIYSYGVVLLEIICCRRNIDLNVASEEEIMLSSWVYECFVKGELNKLVVDDDVEWNTMERMVKVALWCVQEDLSLRPSMRKVILMLEGLKDIPIPPSPTPLV